MASLTVNGGFMLGAGAIYEVEANAQGQADKVIVTGTVNLTGSVLRVLAANGTFKPKTEYLIVDNDGGDAVTGKFASVTTNLAFLSPSVVYNGGDGNDVVLTLSGSSTADFCSVAVSKNQCNVANALNKFPADDPLFLAVLNHGQPVRAKPSMRSPARSMPLFPVCSPTRAVTCVKQCSAA